MDKESPLLLYSTIILWPRPLEIGRLGTAYIGSRD